MNNPLGVSPSKGKQGTTRGKEKIFLTSVGIEPTTSGGLFMGLSSTIIYNSELILCSTICVPSATRHNIHMYPYFLFAAIHHLKSSPTFSVRPCSSVGRVTVDLFQGRGFDSHRGQKIFSLPRVVPCFRLLGLTPSGLYTSELILCSTNNITKHTNST